MDNETYEILKSVDTPTVCNAIDLAWGRRGFSNFTKRSVVVSCDTTVPIVGFAKTVKLKGALPSNSPSSDIKEMRMAYYEYVSNVSRPTVCVCEDLDYPNCVAAYWGEINANVHKAFGIDGILTNGVMRDLDCIPDGFQMIAGSIGVSHMFVNIVEFATYVEVFGMGVKDGDLIHADKHGAMVIPKDVIKDIGTFVKKILELEKIVIEPIKGRKVTFEEFKDIWQKFENARI